MEYENVLLIGGPRDGERISVMKGVPTIRMCSVPSFGAYDVTRANEHTDIQELVYQRHPVQSHLGFKSAIYVFGGIDPMVALIEGYRKP